MGSAAQTAVSYEPAVAAAARPWNLATRILFRFFCCYQILYNMPINGHVNMLDAIPGIPWLSGKYIQLWHAIVPWVAIHVFGLSGPVTVYPAMNGSGDSTLDYVENFCLLVVAAAGALIWSILDRKRTDYHRLHFYLRVFVRYALSFTMFGYGFAKVIPTQFIFPGYNKLMEPLGEFSPMGLLWNFMGYSTAYIIFSGMAEVTGATLLLFRRTQTLGAMATAAVLLNVVMLNFCYDVPVKLYSANLLLMAIFLMLPELGRLANLLVLNRATQPVDLSYPPVQIPRLSPRWQKIGGRVLKLAFVGYFLFGTIKGNWEGYNEFVVHRPKAPIYGLYEVNGFSRNGQEIPPLATDGTRWRYAMIQFPQAFRVRMMDETSPVFTSEYDEKKNTVTVSGDPTKGQKSILSYSRPDGDHVVLQGKVGGDALVITMKRMDPSKFLLVNRGFRWINERPFNR